MVKAMSFYRPFEVINRKRTRNVFSPLPITRRTHLLIINTSLRARMRIVRNTRKHVISRVCTKTTSFVLLPDDKEKTDRDFGT